MRTLFITIALLYSLTACGYRTPLSLPKPQAKSPTSAPVESEAK